MHRHMDLAPLLSQKKGRIADRWLQLVLESYPPESSKFYKNIKDRFDNPVGYRLTQGIKGLVDALFQEMDREQLLIFLDEVISIRALQGFPPSQAMAFLFLLKQVIREELADELGQGHLAAEILDLESRIDGLALLGFDVFMQRREKLCELRVNEVKSRVSGLLRKSGVDLNTL